MGQACCVDRTTAVSGTAGGVQGATLRLTAEMTLADPKSYTRPVVATKRWVEVPNGQLLPYECTAETWYERIEELAKTAGVPVP